MIPGRIFPPLGCLARPRVEAWHCTRSFDSLKPIGRVRATSDAGRYAQPTHLRDSKEEAVGVVLARSRRKKNSDEGGLDLPACGQSGRGRAGCRPAILPPGYNRILG